MSDVSSVCGLKGTPEIQANAFPAANFKLSCPIRQVVCLNLQFNEKLWILHLNFSWLQRFSKAAALKHIESRNEMRNQISTIEN